MIPAFDAVILRFLNQFAQRSAIFDKTIGVVESNYLLKGGIITALFWWAWFRSEVSNTPEVGILGCNRESSTRDREIVLTGIVISIGSLFVARVLAAILPYRERPRFDLAAHFRAPIGAADGFFIDWSSFPSDNAVLYFCLATCLFLISRKLGVLAYLHATLIISFPRVYLGFHYPTDILAGAFLGIGMASLCLNGRLRSAISRLPLRWAEESPCYFYPCFYLSLYLLGIDLVPFRRLALAGWRLLRGTYHIAS